MYKSFSAVFWIPQYFYDPFGKLLSVKNAAGNEITSTTHIAHLNPLRYRGYYYDTETGFYYLQSRYYDPIVCRFINADSYASTGQGFVGCNMFAYCNNNVVTKEDTRGHESESSIWSFEHDWAGVYILLHWLYGNGEDCVFADGCWGSYMKANAVLSSQIDDFISSTADTLLAGEQIIVVETTSAEIENGESIIGYQYLHGTNADAGGFQINGKIGKELCGNITYDLRCTWNDIIDPNYIYSSDRAKASIAHLIANPKDYKISISWSVRSPSYISSGSKKRNSNLLVRF